VDSHTLQYLDGRGFMTEGKINRGEIADRLRDLLHQDGICEEPEQVDEVARTIPEWRSALLGDPREDVVETELNEIVSQAMSIRKEGPVQRRLANGYVLCKPRVIRTVEGADRKQTARLISSNADVIEEHCLVGERASLVRKTESVRAIHDNAAERVPEIASREAQMLTRTRGMIEQLLLVEGDGS
jgi:hypothetical protein